MKIYTYSKCTSCRKAVKWLQQHDYDFEEIPIRETPPSKSELKQMLAIYQGEFRKLYNTSGMDYRSMNIKEKLPSMDENEAIELLQSNGNLVKRPFLLKDKSIGLVGFREAEWADQLT